MDVYSTMTLRKLYVPRIFPSISRGPKMSPTVWCPKVWGHLGPCWFAHPLNFKELLKHLERDFATQLVQTSRRLQKDPEHPGAWIDLRRLQDPWLENPQTRGKTGRPGQQSHLQLAEVKAELFIHIKGSMGMDGMTQESPRKMHAPAWDSKRIVSCLQSGLISLI
jgi:hypothetical protein